MTGGQEEMTVFTRLPDVRGAEGAVLVTGRTSDTFTTYEGTRDEQSDDGLRFL